jgi:hypothetical protein
MNTSGFYKLEEKTLLYGPNFVKNKDYTLLKEEKDIHTYPVDGWYWFDYEEEAYSFFNLEKPIIEDTYDIIIPEEFNNG